MIIPSLFRNQALPCAIALSLLAAGSASAADGTWTGGTSVVWATPENWSGGTVAGSTSANSDTAAFNSASYSFAPTIANGWILGTLLFGSENTGALTVNTGNNADRLNLSGGIQMDAGSGAVIIGTNGNRGIALLNNVSFANNSSSLLTVRVLTVDESLLSGTNTVTINGSGSGGFTLSAPAVDGTLGAGAKLALNINTSGGATSLGEASTYSGGTTLTQGLLQIARDSVGSVGAITSSAIGTGTLALNGGTLSSGSGGGRTLLNAVTVGGNVTLGAAVNNGKLTFSGTIGLGGDTRTLTTESDVVFSNIVSNGGITKTGTGQLTLTGGSANTYSGTTTVNDGNLVLAKTAGVNAIVGGLTIGDGTNSDTVNLGASDQIADTAVVNIIGTASGQRGNFQLLGFNETIGGLSGGGQVQNASSTADSVLTLNVANATTQTSSAVLRNTGGSTTGSLSIVKTGGGTQILDGNMTYTGATTVSAGSLIVNGNQSAATGVLTVSSGATLGGSGTIGGATTISGIHSPGNSPGVQTFASNLTYSGTPTVEWELTGNTTTQGSPTPVFDQIVVNGNLDFTVATTLTLNFALAGSTVDWSNGLWGNDITGASGWLVYDVAGSLSDFQNLSISVENWADGNDVLLQSVRAGSSFSFYTENNDIYLNYAVPEPSTYALLTLLGAAFAGRIMVRRWRRHGVD
jgi:autotransporter-associated beta strand protein